MAYLRYGFPVSHDGLLDKTPDFNVAVSTRHDHPGPTETHRDFHIHAQKKSGGGSNNKKKKTSARG